MCWRHQRIELRDDLSYEEQPVQILGREEKELRNKKISLVKVQEPPSRGSDLEAGSPNAESVSSSLP